MSDVFDEFGPVLTGKVSNAEKKPVENSITEPSVEVVQPVENNTSVTEPVIKKKRGRPPGSGKKIAVSKNTETETKQPTVVKNAEFYRELFAVQPLPKKVRFIMASFMTDKEAKTFAETENGIVENDGFCWNVLIEDNENMDHDDFCKKARNAGSIAQTFYSKIAKE